MVATNNQLPIEGAAKPQSPEDLNVYQHPTIIATSNTTIVMKKRRRRSSSTFKSQTKLIVFLLSLLYIGDYHIYHPYSNKASSSSSLSTYSSSSSTKYGQIPIFGNVFVLGASTASAAAASSSEDNEMERHNHHRNHHYHSKDHRKMMRVNASPNIPIMRKTQDTDEKNKEGKNNKLRNSFDYSAAEKDIQAIRGGGDNDVSKQASFSEILKKAGQSGIGGGIPGAIAGVVQVLTLMWLRTVMNYQCRYGSSFFQSIQALYNQGGIPRFYRGLSFALIQAPLARFVATAANDGVETFLTNFYLTKQWGAGRSTIIASFVVGIWRILLMPIDTCKTVLQVDSVDGFRNLMRKVKAGKIYVLYQGATANAISSIASHYPWFYTFRVLSHNQFLQQMIGSNHLRNAFIGFASSVVSDTFANSIRVVKTAKQAIAAKQSVGYGEVIAMILAVDGFKGLFGRGLRTRILGNALQSVLFTVIWRGLSERKNQSQGDSSRRSLQEDKRHDESSTDDIPKKDVPLEEERF